MKTLNRLIGRVRPAADRWSDVEIADEGFRDRFVKLPGIIDSWVSPNVDLEGAKILDFGCGEGITALGMAMKHESAEVIGVDIMPDPVHCPEQARRHLGLETLPETLKLHQVQAGELPDTARDLDLIYAWSVFEHVDRSILGDVLAQLHGRLRKGGAMFIQIAPLFYSAKGAHLFHKVPEPWGHLTIQANVFEARLRAECESDEEFESLWSTYRTLNRVTADELQAKIAQAGFSIDRTYVTTDNSPIPGNLTSVYHPSVLTTDQVVVLARKTAA
jgi:2-polyprenyl-3-methyl-5-hydroxy-6-metoxy-1,4-benzoquinol methylase